MIRFSYYMQFALFGKGFSCLFGKFRRGIIIVMDEGDEMEYIRKTINSKELESVLDLPDNMKNRQVEVLIFPLVEDPGEKIKDKSLAGIFHRFASPSLMTREQDAWGVALREKHENR